MPWAYPTNVPSVAKNWTPEQQRKCVIAANGTLRGGGNDTQAIQACIRAAGKTKNPGGKEGSNMADAAQWVDVFNATRVLAGDWIRIVPVMPKGYHRGGVHRPPIRVEDIATIVRNFENRATSGFYQVNVPINREHKDAEGKVGIYAAMQARDDGAYARLELTAEGRRLLEAGKFDYFSPEIRWKTIDIETGEDLGISVGGGAFTNYAFFGDRLAMFSETAFRHMVSQMGNDGDNDGDEQGALDALVHTAKAAFGRLFPNAEGGDASSVSMSTSGDSLWVHVHPPSDDDPDPDPNTQEGTMAEDFVSQEDFAALRTQFEEMSTRNQELSQANEDLSARVEQRDEQMTAQREEITQLSAARLRDRMVSVAEGFQALGVENDELSTHLMWLYQVDESDEREHYSFLLELLRTADNGLADARQFGEVGGAGRGVSTTPVMNQIDQLVSQRLTDQGVTAAEGTEEYAEALNAVIEANPELYDAYRETLV